MLDSLTTSHCVLSIHTNCRRLGIANTLITKCGEQQEEKLDTWKQRRKKSADGSNCIDYAECWLKLCWTWVEMNGSLNDSHWASLIFVWNYIKFSFHSKITLKNRFDYITLYFGFLKLNQQILKRSDIEIYHSCVDIFFVNLKKAE